MQLLSNAFYVRQGRGEPKRRVGVGGDGKNVILLGARELVLGGDHLDIIRRSRLETILREFEFTLRQILPFLGDSYLLGSGLNVQQRLTNVLFNAAPQIGDLIIDTFQPAGDFLPPRR